MDNKNLFITIIVLIGFSTTVIAQIAAPQLIASDLKIVNDSINHKVDIEFTSDKEISNLLILITDSLGNTMFLDNQYRFKGYYKQIVDLKEAKKGNYFLKIIKDDEQINKKLKNE